jgi:hypothetical protein
MCMVTCTMVSEAENVQSLKSQALGAGILALVFLDTQSVLTVLPLSFRVFTTRIHYIY